MNIFRFFNLIRASHYRHHRIVKLLLKMLKQHFPILIRFFNKQLKLKTLFSVWAHASYNYGMFSNLFMFADRTDVSFISGANERAFPPHSNSTSNDSGVLSLWAIGREMKCERMTPFCQMNCIETMRISTLNILSSFCCLLALLQSIYSRKWTRILDFVQAKRFIMQCNFNGLYTWTSIYPILIPTEEPSEQTSPDNSIHTLQMRWEKNQVEVNMRNVWKL